jgi:hypothetical protein
MKEQIAQYVQDLLAWLASQVNSILSGIIASLIVISVAEAYGLGQLLFKNSRDRRVWKLRKPSELRIVSGSITDTNPFVQTPTSWPDANAASILIQKARTIYPKARVIHSFSCDPDDLTCDLIAVGGPVFNEATRELIHRIGTFISFKKAGEIGDEDYYSLLVQADEYTPEYEGKRVYRDFGAIVRMKNPLCFHLNDSILVIGCETFGVLASALVLADDEVARNARRELLNHLSLEKRVSDFVAVFSCEALRYSVGAVRLVKFYQLDVASCMNRMA